MIALSATFVALVIPWGGRMFLAQIGPKAPSSAEFWLGGESFPVGLHDDAEMLVREWERESVAGAMTCFHDQPRNERATALIKLLWPAGTGLVVYGNALVYGRCMTDVPGWQDMRRYL